MASVSISELISISDLSAADILGMLARGDLGFEKGQNNELLIDLETVDIGKLSRAPISKRIDLLDPALVEEVIAAEANRFLAEIFNESLEMAIRWSLKKQIE